MCCSGLHGLLTGKDSISAEYTDAQLALSGALSIVGRSVVIHSAVDGARWVCANIVGKSQNDVREQMWAWDELDGLPPRQRVSAKFELLYICPHARTHACTHVREHTRTHACMNAHSIDSKLDKLGRKFELAINEALHHAVMSIEYKNRRSEEALVQVKLHFGLFGNSSIIAAPNT